MDIEFHQFWNRVDDLKDEALTKLCANTGVSYTSVKRNRTDCRLPSLLDAYKIAKYLGTTIEYLLTGNDLISTEAMEVESSPELKSLIRALGRNPNLLHLVSALLKDGDTRGAAKNA